MASQTKEYNNKKFGINEISDVFDKIISDFDLDSDDKKISITHYFKKDGINDSDDLTLKETGRITEISPDESLSLYLGSISRNVGLRYSSFYNNLSISVSGESSDEVKKIFSIIELGLNLIECKEEEKEDTPSDESVTSSNSEIKEVPQIEDTKTDFETDLGSVRLYKEDLIEIIDLITGLYKEIYIKIDSYKITNESQIEEVRLKLKKNTVNNLTISTGQYVYSSRLALIFSENYASIRVDNKKDYESMGVLRLLEDIISKNENKFILRIVKTNWGYALGLILSLVCLIAPISFVKSIIPSTYRLIFLIFWYAIFMVIISYITWISLKRYSVIYLTNSSDESWLKKHASEIVIGLIILIVGSIISAVILNLLNLK